MLRFGSDHLWGQHKNPPGDLNCAQGSLWSSCSVRRTRLMEETWGWQGDEWGNGTQSQGSILRIFPQYFFSPSVPAHILPKGSLFSFPMLSFSHLSHCHHFSEESPGALPPSLGWPHCLMRRDLLPRQPVCQPQCGERGALTLGVLSWAQNPSAQSRRWISQAKRPGHSPFSWAIRATTRGVARRGLLPPTPLGSKTPVR